MYKSPQETPCDSIVEDRIETLSRKLNHVENIIANIEIFKPDDISYTAFLCTCEEVRNRLRWHIKILEHRDYDLINEYRLLDGRNEHYDVPTNTNILAQ